MSPAWPIIWPMLVAAVLLAIKNLPRLRQFVTVVGGLVHAGLGIALFAEVQATGPMTLQLGGWKAPYGITLSADHLAAGFVFLTTLIGLAANLTSHGSSDSRRLEFGYQPLMFALLAGCCGAFLTGDLFNLYVWFEVILMSSFIMLALGGEPAKIRASLRYVILNLISSFIFLAGLGLLYGAIGTLNMADIAVQLRGLEPNLASAIGLMFVVAFLIKAAAFPFFGWLPGSYPVPPTAVLTLFGGLLTKVGVYAVARLLWLSFGPRFSELQTPILVFAGATIIIAGMAALVQTDLRRLLSYLLICHIGSMLLGLSLESREVVGAAVAYTWQHMLVMASLFLVAGMIRRATGTYDLRQMGGLGQSRPLYPWMLAIPLFALAGLPPFSGFWPKAAMVRGMLEMDSVLAVVLLLASSGLTLIAVGRLWANLVWRPAAESREEDAELGGRGPRSWWTTVPVAGLLAVLVWLSLWPQPLLTWSERAGHDLTQARLGGARQP